MRAVPLFVANLDSLTRRAPGRCIALLLSYSAGGLQGVGIISAPIDPAWLWKRGAQVRGEGGKRGQTTAAYRSGAVRPLPLLAHSI